MSISSCADSSQNRHQFKLNYKNSGHLIVECHNCFFFYGNYDDVRSKVVVNRRIDAQAIDLFSSIKFCGVGDTTPDGWVRITTDTGSVVEFGVLFPDQEFNPTLRIQSTKTGLGAGCSRKDQETFEKFFFEYIGKIRL